MYIKNIATFFTVAVIFLFFSISISSAQSIDAPPHMPGIIEGSGTRFEVTDSEYLNVSLDSSEYISARLESAPEMVVLDIKASSIASSAHLKLSGLTPDTTYHKYQDGYQNHDSFTTNESGVFYFDLNLTLNHTIFIQPRKSTQFINASDGGSCGSIGDWNATAKTCSLNQDVNETIQISDSVTLDGNGHTVSGSDTGSGVYVVGQNSIVKNINVTGFYYGIYLASAKYAKVAGVTTNNNRYGIELDHAKYSTVSDSTAENNKSYGLLVYYSLNNTISGNTFGPGNSYGIQQAYTGDYNTYEGNDISNNKNTGIITYGGGNYLMLRNNKIIANAYDGVVIGGDHHTLSGNIMSGNGFGGGNGKSNFSIAGGYMDTNNIDQSNLIEGKPIYYLKNETNKIYDSSLNIGSFYCINCDSITVKDIPLSEHSAKIFFWHTNNSLVENTTSPDKSTLVDMYYSSGNTIKNNDLGKIYVRYSSNNNQVYNNNFSDAYIPANLSSSTGNLFNLDLPTGGNHWKKYEAACQDADDNGFCDLPFMFSSNGVDNFPWVKEFDFGKPSCCSSVIFLPGHQASRLYQKDSDGDEDQLWEPTNHNEDVRQLYLNSDGSSADSNIYTRDIIDKGYGIKSVYKGFMESMDKFVADGIINEWKPIPYDWRLPLEKITEDGITLEDSGHMDIIGEIKRMAVASKTGKVTLVGHSNGGLLAKTLIDKLKESGNENMIDRLIMVATPQLGTPKAMAALLHGDETNLLHGIILDKKTGRGFAENMESAYNLLPSQKYFDTVQSPVVEFDDDVKEIYDFRSLYGDSIDNWDEFKKFLMGDNGKRSDPEFGDTDSPNVLREALLTRADATHGKLDDWQAPEGIEVVQIAGWGLDTIRGIEYDDCDFIFCPDKLSNLDRSLLMTADGDETVVVPSAVEMDGNAERYYLNLNRYNRLVNLKVDREHADILEIESLQNFIKNIITGDKTLTEYLTKEKPEVKDEDKRLRFRLHSPVAIDLYDEDSKHTGLVQSNDSDLRLYEEQIPNSYYTEFGETKYAGAGDSPVNVVLTGEDLGTFTFEIDQVAGDTVAQNTTFANIPVMKDMTATLSVSETISEMKIDIDGDSQIDATFQPGEEIKKEDLLGIFEKIINSLDVEATVKDRLINKIDNAKKQMEKGHGISANAMLENVKQQIENFSDEKTPEKFRIPYEEAVELIGIINQIQLVE